MTTAVITAAYLAAGIAIVEAVVRSYLSTNAQTAQDEKEQAE
jgi:hypothetical protein